MDDEAEATPAGAAALANAKAKGKAKAEGNMNNNSSNGDESDGEYVDTKKADKAVWLMKCPPVVARALQNENPIDPSRPVAKVVLSIDPLRSGDDSSSPKFTMELAATETGAPKTYTLDMSKDFIPMSVFSHSTEGKFAVEGKILNKFYMRPDYQRIEDYGKLCRERTNKYMTRPRQIQVIDNDKGTHMRPMPGMVSSGIFDKKKSPAKGSDVKRTRRDRGEMEGIMFKLFERQPNWTLRQLIQETDQPEQFMKDILKVICVYNHKGSNQGTYELKPEYKRSGGEV